MKLVSLVQLFVVGAVSAVRHRPVRLGLQPLKSVPIASKPDGSVPLVIYVDEGSSQTVAGVEEEFYKMADAGVSTIILSFYMTGSPSFPTNLADMGRKWADFSTADQQRIVAGLHQRGTSILISAGGEAEAGDWQNHDANEYGTTFCAKAKELNVDGVDFDLENVRAQGPAITEWLHQSTKSCREAFPGAIVTSAPQSPYLDPAQAVGPMGTGYWGDMLKVGANDGAIHNHMYIQYYNQGSWYQANSYADLFTSDRPYSISSLMKTYPDVPNDTFYIGKPFSASDYSQQTPDWVDHATLHDDVCKARKEMGWNGGLMFWQHHFNNAEQIEKYKVLSAPCEGVPPVTTTTSTSTSTSTRSTTASTTPSTVKSTTTTGSTTTNTARSTSTSTGSTGKSTTKSTTRAPITTTTTSTTHAPTTQGSTTQSSAVIADCVNRLTATQDDWVSDCKSKCSLYGPGGLLEAYCVGKDSTGKDLAKCVTKYFPYCIAN